MSEATPPPTTTSTAEGGKEMTQVHPGTGTLMSLHVPPTELTKCLNRVDYLGSRGLSGLGALKNYVARHRRKAERTLDISNKEMLGWFKIAPLHGAVMNGHVDTTLPYIVDEMGASLNTVNEHGNTALHHSVIWGRTACIVWLLERGANTEIQNKEGDTPLSMAHIRQNRLNDKELQSTTVGRLDRDVMIREGLELVRILSEVNECGSYFAWAKKNPRHELVTMYSPWSRQMDNRVGLTLLRRLVMDGRARMLTPEEVEEKKEQELEKEEEKKRLQSNAKDAQLQEKLSKVQIPTLMEAMKQGNVDDLKIGLSAMECTTYVGLNFIEKDVRKFLFFFLFNKPDSSRYFRYYCLAG
jgi:hypothetical protein